MKLFKLLTVLLAVSLVLSACMVPPIFPVFSAPAADATRASSVRPV